MTVYVPCVLKLVDPVVVAVIAPLQELVAVGAPERFTEHSPLMIGNVARVGVIVEELDSDNVKLNGPVAAPKPCTST